jgi:hypothetical protein
LKSWTGKKGGVHTGGPFTLTGLRRLLGNITYTGMIRHKDQICPGEQEAIISRDTWESAITPFASTEEFYAEMTRN